jgi:hypothetical protein
VKIAIEIETEQWFGEGHPLPLDTYLCQPEVCWSADRKPVYFTYADLVATCWISASPSDMQAAAPCMGSVIVCNSKERGSVYRSIYPFSFWDVKSEASTKCDWRAVYLDRTDEALVATFVDVIYANDWTNPLPPRAEHRLVDGSLGCGFAPTYLKPGDWLIREPGANPRVVSDNEFQALRVTRPRMNVSSRATRFLHTSRGSRLMTRVQALIAGVG